MIRYIVFVLAYLYFLWSDIRKKEIHTLAIAIYAIIALMTITLSKNVMSVNRLIDIIFSISFGLIIYMLAYFSSGGMGIADGMYFVINGLLLTLKENIFVFFSGLLIAFIIGIVLFLKNRGRDIKDIDMPFLPCCIPGVIGIVLCIV